MDALILANLSLALGSTLLAELPNIQQPLTTHDVVPGSIMNSEGDPAGRPNLATRIEITSPTHSTLFCAKDGDTHEAGYAHFTNAMGDEDKHMFWSWFHTRNTSASSPVILFIGGGPGTAGSTIPFGGQGHCKIVPGPDGRGMAVPSDDPWTDFAHILAVDYPVGTGFSYGSQGSLRNSSERSAWDLDDMLQAFWRANPGLVNNQFAVLSGSYGGTYIPNLVKVIRDRNTNATEMGNKTRVLKLPDTVMMSNPSGDSVAKMRYSHAVSCDDMGFFNTSICHDILRATPGCLDSLQLATEQPSIANKAEAIAVCADVIPWEKDDSGLNPYDRRQKCNTKDITSCFPFFKQTTNMMNDERLRDALGLPRDLKFKYMATEEVMVPFFKNGDPTQRAYKLMSSAIDDGMRVLVFSGLQDAICPARTTEAWLRLLSSKHQSAFREAVEIEWPDVGSYYSVGSGDAGELAFVKVKDAGHFVMGHQPKVIKHLVDKWLRNEKFA